MENLVSLPGAGGLVPTQFYAICMQLKNFQLDLDF